MEEIDKVYDSMELADRQDAFKKKEDLGDIMKKFSSPTSTFKHEIPHLDPYKLRK
jgi:hypothetical protein